MTQIPASFTDFTSAQRRLLALLLEDAVETAQNFSAGNMPVGCRLYPDQLIASWLTGEGNREVIPLMQWNLVVSGVTTYADADDTGYRLTHNGVKVARLLHNLSTTDPSKESVTHIKIWVQIQTAMDELVTAARQRIGDLQKSWLKDPCWDIETTEGFEAYHDELKAYREEIEAETTAAIEAEESARTVKTLVQTISENGVTVVDRADRELQQHMEKGWTIAHLNYMTYEDNTGDWTVIIIKRAVILTRKRQHTNRLEAAMNTIHQGL